ncbi:ABC transporter ATP-binding protein [Neorhizobium alkalisoli]|uniref:ABC transporter ATP-binding protein n=1 Tax=Neorhizobium alkalisoli TaxID=528178 RepID=UPI000CF9AF6B|nr:sn-glycerol-3-phosphate ABC transporter ATP-binding protein UgpC [Neorhizobium alkalisoli]
MASIIYKNITKRYADGTKAVDNLNLEIREGEFMIVVGPSGCGKTTALRMAAGLEDITDGQLTIGDRVVNDLEPRDRDIAMVFQNYALYPHMTIFENIAFPLQNRNMPAAEVKQRVQAAARTLGLEEHLDRRPKHLSGGQRQRVAMGRAIVRRPKAFLMDEPLSNLDAKLRVQMRAEITRMQRDLGVTTLYVTHDQVEAMTMGDRIAVMRKGVLQQVGAPVELYEKPANLFVASFIGSPAMNLVQGRVTNGNPFGVCEIGRQQIALTSDVLRNGRLSNYHDRDLVIGIRPEHLEDPQGADPMAPRLTAKIRLVEMLPPEQLVHLELDAEPVASISALELAADVDKTRAENLRLEAQSHRVSIVARLPSGRRYTEGETAEWAINPANLHFFDGETGEVLR